MATFENIQLSISHEGSEISVEVRVKKTPNQRPRPSGLPCLIVLHSAECGETSNAAESLATWVAGSGRPQWASWHFAVDDDSITQSVDPDNKAWHAKQVNGYSVGIEQAGRAKQTKEQWADEFSAAMLERVSRLLAYLSVRYRIPLEIVGADQIAEMHDDGGAWGITTHAEVSKAFKIKGGHWDPGPNYPIEDVVKRADEILKTEGMAW